MVAFAVPTVGVCLDGPPSRAGLMVALVVLALAAVTLAVVTLGSRFRSSVVGRCRWEPRLRRWCPVAMDSVELFPFADFVFALRGFWFGPAVVL